MKVFCIILGFVAILAAVKGFLKISAASGDYNSSSYWIGGPGDDMLVIAIQLIFAFFLLRYGFKKSHKNSNP